MTCVEPQRMRMTRSFSHYTDGAGFYLTLIFEIFVEDQKIVRRLGPRSDDLLILLYRKIIRCPNTSVCSNPNTPCNELNTARGSLLGKLPLTRRAASSSFSNRIRPG